MDIYQIVEFIKKSGQRGQELLIDALLVGIEIGRSDIKEISYISCLVNQLFCLKQHIDSNVFSPFIRDDVFNRVLNNQEHLGDVLSGYQNKYIRQSIIKVEQNLCQLCCKPINQSEQQQFNADCKHQFHKQCLFICLNENDKEFKCPTCLQLTIQETIQQKLGIIKNQKKSICPTINCDQEFIYRGQDLFKCQKCKKRFCLKCRSEFHPNFECQQQNYTKNPEVFPTEFLMKECPNCREWGPITQNDNYLNCCQTSFCLKCGQEKSNCNCQQKGQKFSLFSLFRKGS